MCSSKRAEQNAGGVKSHLRPSTMILCRSLEVGGAERQLVELACGMQRRGWDVCVAVFYAGGPLSKDLQCAGVRILNLRKRGRWDIAGFILRTARTLRQAKTEIVYSFLGGPNIGSALVRCLVPNVRLVWSIRSSNVDLARYGWPSRLSYGLERALARLPDMIIANSEAGRQFAIINGFPEQSIAVIPNGIDTNRFRPDTRLRAKQRQDWGVADCQIVVGILARLDPMKDHPSFLRAMSLLAEVRPDLKFICVGEGCERSALEGLAIELGIANRVQFTGTADPVEALNGFDVACSSSSSGEGFPNAIAEAMACGKPCVVTDVGDSGLIVGSFGTVVPAGDPYALAAGVLRELTRKSPERSAAGRQRIASCFSVDSMVEGTIAVLGRAHRRDRPESRSASACAE